LYAAPVIQTDLPSAGRVSFLHQAEQRRYVAHLLYAPPLERGQCAVIEDLPPLYEVPLAVCVPEEVVRAYLVPGAQNLEIERSGDVVRVTVPKVQCHQAVIFEYR
jgi:hypothetical protein